MTIKINDREYELPEGSTLLDAMEKAQVRPKGIATAVNNVVVPTQMRSKKVLADGDTVVIITAFYGG